MFVESDKGHIKLCFMSGLKGRTLSGMFSFLFQRKYSSMCIAYTFEIRSRAWNGHSAVYYIQTLRFRVTA